MGRNYTVKASIGHVLDLPKRTDRQFVARRRRRAGRRKPEKKGSKKAKAKPAGKLIALDDDKIFEPTLQIIAGKGKVIRDPCARHAQSADAVYLAGDPDLREGEAISAHLADGVGQALKVTEQRPSSSLPKRKAKPRKG